MNYTLSVPDVVQQMKLKALQDGIQQTNSVLYCLWNISSQDVEGVQMPAYKRKKIAQVWGYGQMVGTIP